MTRSGYPWTVCGKENSSVKGMKCTVKEQNKGLCDWSTGTRGTGMVPDRLEKSCAGDGLQFKLNTELDGKFLHGSKGWAATKSMK